jgi:hypothetical protein
MFARGSCDGFTKLIHRHRTLTQRTTSNTEAILDNTHDSVAGTARPLEAIPRREEGTREGSNHVLQGQLDILTRDTGFVLEEGDNEVVNGSVVSPPDGVSIATSSLVNTAVQDMIDVPPRLQRDVPSRFPRIQNEAFAEDPLSYFEAQNTDRNQVRRRRRLPMRWEHHPEFDNIGLENEVDARQRLRSIQEIEQVPDWKVQPYGGTERYEQYVDYAVTEEGYIKPGRTTRGHLSDFWRKPRLQTNAERIKWFYKYTTSGGDVNSILTLPYPDPLDPSGRRVHHLHFEALMVAILTRNEEWLDYLIAEGAEFGPTCYPMDIFGNPENILGNRMIRYRELNPRDNYSSTAAWSRSDTSLSPIRAALNWNFATFRKLEDRYALLQQADFLEFVGADHSHHIDENFSMYIAGYFVSVLARSHTRGVFKDILSVALQAAIAQNKTSLVRLLLASGAKVNDLRYKTFQVPLAQYQWETVELLIAAGESLNRRVFYADGFNAMSAWEYAALLGNLYELNRIQGTNYQVPIPAVPVVACVIL